MYNLKKCLAFSAILLGVQLNGQKFANVSDIDIGNSFARIIGEITYDGQTISTGTEIAAFEMITGNIVGHTQIFEQDLGGGDVRSYFDFIIYGSTMNRTQLTEMGCFKLSIFFQSDIDSIDIVVDSSDPRLCNVTSTTIQNEDGQGLKLDIKKSNLRQAEPSQFGGYTGTNGAPLSLDWDGFGSEGPLQALPVEYSSISLRNNKCESVSFEWTTSSEIGNEGFYVERREEGEREWESLGFVEGSGTTAREVDYSFTDDEITKDKSLRVVYYRLKQIDFNGRYEYSEMKSIRLNCGNKTFINVYPNPVEDYSSISIHDEDLKNDEVVFEVFNMSGQLIQKFTRRISSDEVVSFNTADYTSGVFRVQAITNNQIIAHTRFIKN